MAGIPESSQGSAHRAEPATTRSVLSARWEWTPRRIARMRALLSVSDKTGLVPVRAAPWRRAAGSWCRPAARPGRWPRRPRRDRHLGGHRLSRDDGRARQDAAPEGARRASSRGVIVPDDLAALATHGIAPIDLVVVNLYPFARAAARPDVPFDDLIEEIDIGGPSLVRAAAKNFRDVLVVVDPADYDRVLEALAVAGRSVARGAVRSGAARDRPHRGLRHDDRGDARADSPWTSDRRVHARSGRPRAAAPGRLDAARSSSVRDLRYGENPHQPAAWYAYAGAATAARRRPAAVSPRRRASGQGAVVHEPARSRRGRAHRARVRRAGGRRDQAHEPVRRGDRRRRSPRRTSARARPMRSRRLAASSGSTGRSISTPRARSSSTFIEAVIAPGLADSRRGARRARDASRISASSRPTSRGSTTRATCGRFWAPGSCRRATA